MIRKFRAFCQKLRVRIKKYFSLCSRHFSEVNRDTNSDFLLCVKTTQQGMSDKSIIWERYQTFDIKWVGFNHKGASGPGGFTGGIGSRRLYFTSQGRVKLSGLFRSFNCRVNIRGFHIRSQNKKKKED